MSNLINLNFQASAIRSFTDEKKQAWFCVADICTVLGYANSRDALARHCKQGGVVKHDTPINGVNQQLTYINEPNLYRLIIKSRKPEAEAFEAWVMEEVLPSIRKTGSYATPTEDASTDLFLNAAHARAQARKAGLAFYDARQAILKQINTPAALALGLPPATEQIAEGVISDMFTAGRFLLSFDKDSRLQMHQMHPNDIVINPNNLVSAILHSVIKPAEFPFILGAIAEVLERKTHQRAVK